MSSPISFGLIPPHDSVELNDAPVLEYHSGVSVVMEIKDNRNTFKLKRSFPDTSSYARNIAEKYGITYEQMKEIGET